MSVTSFDATWGVGATRIALNVETALWCQPVPGQLSTTLKFISGGSLEILASGYGQSNIGFFQATTLTAAGLTAATSTGYQFSAAEVVKLGGPAYFYLNARGATCVAFQYFETGKGQ